MAPKIKWNLRGFRELRTLPAVQADMESRAERVAGASGAGYEVPQSGTGRNRARAAVVTTSMDAVRDNARNNTLLRNLGAGK